MNEDGRSVIRNTIIVATSNDGKLRELTSFLPSSTTLLSLRDVHLDSPEETGRSFLDNAILKAQYATRNTGYPALADDSGLEVDGLGGDPGIRSARYAGSNASDEENNSRLICKLRNTAEDARSARFRCAVAFASPDGLMITAEADLSGWIIETPRGSNGFGYDPLFQIEDRDAAGANGRTVAELSLDEKNEISHRARAYRQLVARARTIESDDEALALLFDAH